MLFVYGGRPLTTRPLRSLNMKRGLQVDTHTARLYRRRCQLAARTTRCCPCLVTWYLLCIITPCAYACACHHRVYYSCMSSTYCRYSSTHLHVFGRLLAPLRFLHAHLLAHFGGVTSLHHIIRWCSSRARLESNRREISVSPGR